MPWVKIEFSIENSLVKTPSGQRIDQTAVKHFLKFIINNRQVIEKNEHSAAEDGDQITFTFWALDYIQGNDLERYILQVSKQNWLPMQVDRFDKENRPVETTSFKKVAINIGLRDDFFVP
jgi:outer membrane lipoprotein-sorting protein